MRIMTILDGQVNRLAAFSEWTLAALLGAKDLAEAAEVGEREVVAATQSAIEKHRKADAKIRVVAGDRCRNHCRADRSRLPLRLQHLHVRPLQERGPERRLQEAIRGVGQPLAVAFAAMGHHWNDEHGVPCPRAACKPQHKHSWSLPAS